MVAILAGMNGHAPVFHTCVVSVYSQALVIVQGTLELVHTAGPNNGWVNCLGRGRTRAIIQTVRHSDSFISMLRNDKILKLIFILHFVD